ncbi:MAG: hypothetical protein IJI53_12125 [Clostridia bacterium]|nr:hypothetical protein [Clostridia bacterium]MBR0408777.1 hypothetical protein [Clostridia bacterium]
MIIHIHVDSMKAAERLSNICKEYDNDFFLRSEKFCIDPKSTLGIMAMMYSVRNRMFLDTGALGEKDLAKFLREIDSYMVNEAEAAIAQ